MVEPRFFGLLWLLTASWGICTQLWAADGPVLPFPQQLEATVPYEPTVLFSGGRQRLVYELVLRNFEAGTLELQQLSVINADDPVDVLAHYDVAQLQKMIRTVGPQSRVTTILGGGSSAVVYMLLTFDNSRRVPDYLQHKLVTSAGTVVTSAISTHRDTLQVLTPPVTGAGWLVETGLSNDNGHRRGNLLLHGKLVISRRYAFDWIKVEDGVQYKGDKAVNASYLGYGEKLLAVADATVAGLTDGVPQNVPGRRPFVTFDKLAGNNVVLDIGHGHYAHYMHMQPGSIRVKIGDRVRRGQVLGLLGNSGDSVAPHLHFEVTTSPMLLAGEGVPYVFDSFKVVDAERKVSVRHQGELPMENMLLDFGN